MNRTITLGLVTALSVPLGLAAPQMARVAIADESPATLELTAPAAGALTEERVREIIREEIAANPRVVLDSVEAYMKEQQAAEVLAVNERTVAQKARIAETEGLPYSGNPDGTIEIVYFFDVNCGYCKRLDPSIKRVVSENPDVRVYHREIPILAPSSRMAAFLEGLVWEIHPDAYHRFHDLLMAHGGSMSDADVVAKLAQAVGQEEADRLLGMAGNAVSDPTAKKVNDRIQGNLALAESAGITGTPFVYVLNGDGIMRGAGEDAYEQLSGLVAKARGPEEG